MGRQRTLDGTVKTALRIDPRLLANLKDKAREEGISVNTFICRELASRYGVLPDRKAHAVIGVPAAL